MLHFELIIFSYLRNREASGGSVVLDSVSDVVGEIEFDRVEGSRGVADGVVGEVVSVEGEDLGRLAGIIIAGERAPDLSGVGGVVNSAACGGEFNMVEGALGLVEALVGVAQAVVSSIDLSEPILT